MKSLDEVRRVRQRLAGPVPDEGHDLFGLFDELLPLLDSPDVVMATEARQALEQEVCKGMTNKEQLLKCCAALSWYGQGVKGLEFLLVRLAQCVGQLEAARVRGEASDLVQAMSRAVEAVAESGRIAGHVVLLCRLLWAHGEKRAITDLLLDFAESQHGSISGADMQLVASVVGAELESGDGRVVHVALAAVRQGAGVGKLRTCVLSPNYALSLATGCITTALKQYCEKEDDAKLTLRGGAAVALLRHLLVRCGALNEQHLAEWLASTVQAVIEYCVRCPVQEERLAAWSLVETAHGKLTVSARMQSLADLLEKCPFDTVAALLIARIKNELAADTASWCSCCRERLFPHIFRVPKDASELSSRQDAVMAALNLLLFLTIRERQMQEADKAVVRELRKSYLGPLEQLLSARLTQARMPVSVEQQNKLMEQMEVQGVGAKQEWTEETLKTAQQKTLVADELTMSVIRRIESFVE